jgi:hypothetical protein
MVYEHRGFTFGSARFPGEINIATMATIFTAAGIMMASGDFI